MSGEREGGGNEGRKKRRGNELIKRRERGRK